MTLEEPGNPTATLMETTEALMVVLDPHGKITYFNQACEELSGYSRDEVLGTVLWDFILPEGYVEQMRHSLCSLLSGESSSLTEVPYPWLTKEGAERLVEWNHYVTTDARGKATQVLAIGAEIADDPPSVMKPEGFQERPETSNILFEYAPDAYYLNDLRGRFIDGNREAERILGYMREELIGKSFLQADLLPASQIPKAASLLARNALGFPTGPDELTLKRKDGRWVPVEIRTFPIRTKGQRMVLGIARDITKRNQAEEGLRESEEKFRTLFESTREGIMTVNADSEIISANPAAATILGYNRPNDLIGTPIVSLYVNPQDREAAIETLHEQGYAEGIEVTLKKKDGTPVHTLASVTAHKDAEGNIVRMEGVFRDITERKQAEEDLRASEELYRSLVDAAGSGVTRVNREGKRLFVGGNTLGVGDITPEDFQKGEFASHFIPEDREKTWAQLRETFRTGNPVRGIVSRWMSKKGLRYTSSNWEPIRDPDGNIVEVQTTSIDITEQMETERRRLEAERLEALATMAGGIAHDVNNVLTMITLWTNIAHTKAGTPQGEEAIRNIMKATRDGTETMRRLRRFSGPGGKTEGETVDLTTIAVECLEFTRPMWKDAAEVKEQYIQVIEDLGEVPGVSGNNAELREVLVNLITNAIEAMPRGGTLTVNTFQRDNSACISVSDTGMGMSEEVASQIFDPYFTTKGREGSGLGLSAVKGIVTAHGGEITAQSNPEAGSTFTISLPVPATGEKEERPDAKSPQAEQTPGSQRYDVLVVDDEALVRGAIETVLKQEGHRTVATEDGLSALEAFGKGEFDVVLLDVGMPEMNGYRVAEEMKKLRPDVPILLVTGWGDDVDQERAEAIGVDSVVSKPFEPQQLLQQVNEAMERRTV